MSIPKSICVFCASAAGKNEIYVKSAFEVGQKIASIDSTLIYGGGKVGLMGAVADGALSKQGEVIGIIPKFMTPHEIAHQGISKLIEVESMHERKMLMHEMSDAVITLPGGYGTFEELFEIVTWIQLGLYKKPVALLNTNGYYNHLKKQLDLMKDEGLLKETHRPLVQILDTFEEIMAYFEAFKPAPSIFEMKKQQT